VLQRGNDEPGELDEILGQDQPFGEEDQVEADKEKDRRRNDLAKLVDQEGAETCPPPGAGRIDRVNCHGSLPSDR